MFRVEIQLDANSSVEVMGNLVEETPDDDEVVSMCNHALPPPYGIGYTVH